MSEILNSDGLAGAIYTERMAVQAFIDLLKKEENALSHGQIEDLEVLTIEKNRLLEKLETLGEQRMQLLSLQGYSSDKEGLLAWLAKETNQEIKVIWDELAALAKIAQQMNQTNGKIISTLMMHNQHTYQALQGAVGNVSLYGPKGQALL